MRKNNLINTRDYIKETLFGSLFILYTLRTYIILYYTPGPKIVCIIQHTIFYMASKYGFQRLHY